MRPLPGARGGAAQQLEGGVLEELLDIDRLEPSETRELVRLVRLLPICPT